MTVKERLARCRIIEKMEKYDVYAKRLGISNASRLYERKDANVVKKR